MANKPLLVILTLLIGWNGLSPGRTLTDARNLLAIELLLRGQKADMTGPTHTAPWYTDIRYVSGPEKISLDISRHIPRRVMVGPVVIIHHRPEVFLPVLKRRWVTLTREVQRHYASTLDRFKKESLQDELNHLTSTTFSTNPALPAAVHIARPGQITGAYNSLYIAMIAELSYVKYELDHLMPGGLLVLYAIERGD